MSTLVLKSPYKMPARQRSSLKPIWLLNMVSPVGRLSQPLQRRNKSKGLHQSAGEHSPQLNQSKAASSFSSAIGWEAADFVFVTGCYYLCTTSYRPSANATPEGTE